MFSSYLYEWQKVLLALAPAWLRQVRVASNTFQALTYNGGSNPSTYPRENPRLSTSRYGFSFTLSCCIRLNKAPLHSIEWSGARGKKGYTKIVPRSRKTCFFPRVGVGMARNSFFFCDIASLTSDFLCTITRFLFMCLCINKYFFNFYLYVSLYEHSFVLYTCICNMPYINISNNIHIHVIVDVNINFRIHSNVKLYLKFVFLFICYD